MSRNKNRGTGTKFDAAKFTSDTLMMYRMRLYEIAISSFEWTGLPDGIDERALEWWLLRNGVAAFLYDEMLKGSREAPEGYAVMQVMMGGQWDNYNIPKIRTAYSVNGYNKQFSNDDSVLMFNNYLRVPTFFTLDLFARRLAELDRTIDVNVVQQKTPRVVRCSEAQLLTFKNLFSQVSGNEPIIYAQSDIDVNGLESIDISAPFLADKLQVTKHQIWNEALTYLGIENTNTDKKERMVTDEVMSNMGDVEAQRFTRLNARKQACEMVNDMFGLSIECEFRSGIYIRTDKEGRVPTEGMGEDTVGGGEGGY